VGKARQCRRSAVQSQPLKKSSSAIGASTTAATANAATVHGLAWRQLANHCGTRASQTAEAKKAHVPAKSTRTMRSHQRIMGRSSTPARWLPCPTIRLRFLTATSSTPLARNTVTVKLIGLFKEAFGTPAAVIRPVTKPMGTPLSSTKTSHPTAASIRLRTDSDRGAVSTSRSEAAVRLSCGIAITTPLDVPQDRSSHIGP
jgi:hypothetical protein